jgi:hypothetical protein
VPVPGSFRDRLRQLVPGAFVLAKGLGLLYSPRSYLRSTGYLRSVASNRPCRADGSPLPWMNYGMIGLLEARLHRGLSVFEYGGGYSTLFFAGLVGTVVSVESNPDWHARITPQLPANARVDLCHPFNAGRYVGALPDQQRAFDIVVVDAEEREACLDIAWQYLTAGGVILLDDAGRPRYAEAMAGLVARGFRRLDFDGLKPGGLRSYRTTVFYRDGNVLGI